MLTWQALEANASLQSLLLAGNAFMGPDGAKAIGNMLTFNDSLTTLDLSGCGIYREVNYTPVAVDVDMSE